MFSSFNGIGDDLSLCEVERCIASNFSGFMSMPLIKSQMDSFEICNTPNFVVMLITDKL